MSFLQNYRTFCSGNEANPTYHIFAGLAALSAVTQRRIWIDQGYFKIYPNLYVVLVGPAGGRKTTAMDIAAGLVEKLGTVPFMTDCVTKEKLIMDIRAEERVIDNMPEIYKKDGLNVVSPTALFLTELSDFLGPSSVGMINFLTAVYDRQTYTYKTKNKGAEKLIGPYLTILACTTPEWITTYLRSDVISGGFSRRTLFVYEWEEGRRIPWPTVTPDMIIAWEKALSHCREVQKLAGPMKWDDDAKKFYEQWYVNLVIPNDDTVRGYYKSKHIQLLKVAMLVSLAESVDMVLRKSHLEFGLELLHLAEANLLKVFQGMGRNELHAVANKALDYLRNTPAREIDLEGKKQLIRFMPDKQLKALLYKDAGGRDIDDIIHHLVNTEKVRRAQHVAGTQVRTFIILNES